MLKTIKVFTTGCCVFYIDKNTTDAVRNIKRYLRDYNTQFSRSTPVLETNPEETPISGANFQAQVSSSLQEKFPRQVAKSIARKMVKGRNSKGMGLVGPIVEKTSDGFGKVAYSRKGISKKNHKRRTATTFYKLAQRFIPNLSHEELERIHNSFANSMAEIKLLSGQDACDIYHLPHGEPFRSCMQKGYWKKHGHNYDWCGHENDHLFLSNPDKLFLAVAYKGNNPVARAKVYKNDNGTYWVSRQYGDEGEWFLQYKSKELNCTLKHNKGEMMPYLDYELINRLDDEKVHFSNDYDGHLGSQYTDGSDPTDTFCCSHCNRTRPKMHSRQNICRTCINDYYVNFGGQIYNHNETVAFDDIRVPHEFTRLCTIYGSRWPIWAMFQHNGRWYSNWCIMQYNGEVGSASNNLRIDNGPHSGKFAPISHLDFVNGQTQLKAQYV